MRRPRFTLRTTLIAVTLLGAGLGLYGRHLAEQRRQSTLVDVARKACEATKALEKVSTPRRDHPNYRCFHIRAYSLNRVAIQAIEEAKHVKQLVVMERLSPEQATDLESDFYLVGTQSHFQHWARIGYHPWKRP